MHLKSNMRAFLVLSLLVFLSEAQNQALAQQNNRRDYVKGMFALEIDGSVNGWIEKAEGGNAEAELTQERTGQETQIKKSIGAVNYQELTLTVGGNMSKVFYQWIKDSLEGKAAPRTFSLVSVDKAYREKSRRIFHDTLISEVSFPKLASDSNDEGFITVKLTVSKSQRISGKGVQLPKPGDPRQASNGIAQFRLKIEGVDAASSQASEIDSFTIKLLAPTQSDKDSKTRTRVVEYSNLSFSLPERAAEPFYALEESFLIKGENSDRDEKTGTLSYLASNQTELFSFDFSGLGLIKLASDEVEAGAERGRRIKPDMYMEDIRFQYSPAGF